VTADTFRFPYSSLFFFFHLSLFGLDRHTAVTTVSLALLPSLPSERSLPPVNGPGTRISPAPDHRRLPPTPLALLINCCPLLLGFNFFRLLWVWGFRAYGLVVVGDALVLRLALGHWLGAGGDNRVRRGRPPRTNPEAAFGGKVWIDCRE
jgi:hypothetical protein